MIEYNTHPYHEGTLDRHIDAMYARERADSGNLNAWHYYADVKSARRNRDRLTAYKRKRDAQP